MLEKLEHKVELIHNSSVRLGKILHLDKMKFSEDFQWWLMWREVTIHLKRSLNLLWIVFFRRYFRRRRTK